MGTAVARVGDVAIEKGGAGYSVVVGAGTAKIEVCRGDERGLGIVVVVDEVVDGPTSAGSGEGNRRMKVDDLADRRGRKWRSVDGGSDLGGWMMACCH